MKDYCREYKKYEVHLVYLDPNETVSFNKGVNERFVSAFVFQGDCARVQDGADLPAWSLGYYVDPPECKLTSSAYTAGPDGTSWLCIECMQGVGSPDTVQTGHVVVAGDYTLSAGWGFAVAQGSVTADGKTATPGLYFGPRATNITVSGNADIIILKGA
jgi:hypothetical protein